MVDRYCRLVCDEGVSPDAVLAFTFTDKAAAELRQRIRAELAAAGRGRLRAGPRAARRDRRRLGDDDPRLLQPAARRPPGRGRDRPPLPGARRAGGRAGGARGLRRGARGVPRRAATRRARRPSRPSRSTACGRSSPAPTPSCAAAAIAEPRLPEPPQPDVAGALRRAAEAAAEALGGAEAEQTPSASCSSGRSSALAGARARRPASTSCAALRTDSKAKAMAAYREAIDAAVARAAEAGEGGEAYRHVADAARALLRALRGGQGAARRDRLRGPADPRRAAARADRDRRAPTGPASATCWSTSSRTPTACSCG